MSTAKKLVDQMLGEAEVNPTGAPPPPPGPGDRRPSTLHSAPLPGADDDDEDGGDNGVESDPEERFQQELDDAIFNGIENAKVRTFSDVGVMTNNKGLVVTTPYGSFQVSIVKAR